jgi:hypothetical protein
MLVQRLFRAFTGDAVVVIAACAGAAVTGDITLA